MHTCTHTDTITHMHAHAHAHTDTHAHIYACMHTYTCTHTDTITTQNAFFYFFKDLFYVYEYTVVLFRHTRRVRWIPLQMG